MRAPGTARARSSTEEYEDFLRDEIPRVVGLQEELGLDVLVHGEAERNDMVQYFAENLDGFAVTAQRLGAVLRIARDAPVDPVGRCVSSGADHGRLVDVRAVADREAHEGHADRARSRSSRGRSSATTSRSPTPPTRWRSRCATRSPTSRPPASGIIQVDEPALRELLPLKKADQPAYLDWSVGSFRLATAGAATPTQVHTHLCYSEFDVVIDAIAALDADVTSIEAARSRGEVIGDIAGSGFDHGIGPGVYDIHSPRVPSVAEVEDAPRARGRRDCRCVRCGSTPTAD